ncbi:Retrovirus-related Pol polyprotein from transposon TNT 1-94 [Araneus ventricosus]|uniref:Retrovirus-related Pol polyprotein from transposon TNT 1-94 n=1 Tax=Araneus ventricosus TaxID=182803 RepID=A0A4Y2HJ12_ARAVE|nr:Retrovirus-related Pol polyprotein from transposon TNT 1-94 [Araneus ventricosus]GBM65330.1 Retrovirus-related Pol polyprotein from transposon TNT 1-94 [Araneus ventricosus]
MTDITSLEQNVIPCKSIDWVCKAVPRSDGSRIDIYYGIEGTNVRLRSFNDIMGYCERNKIQCDKNLFNFSGKNIESGKVTDLLNLNEANLLEVRIPRTYKEAIKVPEASKWEDAMKQELKVMYERNVWELVKPPKDAKTLSNRWVYTLKRNEQNEIVTYKARLVAQGFNQIKGESYDEVFSPVVNFSIIRLFFTVFVCLFKWLNVQIDINNAYLYANLDEVIYMSQPEGFVVEADKVCRLKRAIYGLHQSGRHWFLEMDNVLKELNFLKLEWCNCVYMYKNKLILLLYVDAIILFAKNRKDLELGIDLLKRHFELKVLGKTKKLLGIEFMEVDGKLFIHQNSYIDKVCNLYSKFKFPISSLPIPKGQVLSKLDSPCTKPEVEEMSNLPYRNLLGSLAFIAGRTRPDIMYAVNLLSQFQSNPGIKHWQSLL